MNIDSIKNGLVIDHIHAGGAMRLYNLLGLDELDCTVAIIKNAQSGKLGRKDIIKIFFIRLCRADLIGNKAALHKGRDAGILEASGLRDRVSVCGDVEVVTL